MPEAATPDALIAPEVFKLKARLEAGTLTAEERAKPHLGWPLVPDALLPFIKSPSLEHLAEVLKVRPGLYWHPLVTRQVRHLVRLSRDESESDEHTQSALQHLMRLVEAHAGSLVRRRIGWKNLLKKTGPKGRIENPHPAMPCDEFLDGGTLGRDFDALRVAFKAKLKTAKWTPTGATPEEQRANKRKWYRDRALEALKGSDIDWSALRYRPPRALGTHPSGSGPSTDPGGSGESAESPSEEYFTAEDLAEPEPWKAAEASLGDAILEKLTPGMGTLKKDGEPGCLAYVTLAALLNVPPTRVRDVIENYRRKKPTKPKRATK